MAMGDKIMSKRLAKEANVISEIPQKKVLTSNFTND